MGLGDIHWAWSLFLERTTEASQDPSPQASNLPTVPEDRSPFAFFLRTPDLEKPFEPAVFLQAHPSWSLVVALA